MCPAVTSLGKLQKETTPLLPKGIYGWFLMDVDEDPASCVLTHCSTFSLANVLLSMTTT